METVLSGISAITIGQSHIDNKTECQDSAILDFNDKYVMGAVAELRKICRCLQQR